MSLRKEYSLSSTSPSTPIRITSTPFPTRRKSILPSRSSNILSRRYSLSDVDYLSPIQKNLKFFNQKDISNSLRSPNNRTNPENKEKLLINHQQMKYSTPGVFPIVHLNKPNLPILKEKSKNVNAQLASPELCRQNSAQHNRLLLEKVIQNCSKLKTTGVTTTTTNSTATTTTTNRSIDISTRSVLDALKEISRKRIHTSEELDYLDDGKRIRLDNNNDDLLLNLKRPRGESPPHESYQNSSKQQQVKKHCSMNEILASQSSMEIKSSPPPVAQSSNRNKQISRSREIEVEVDVHRPSKKPNLVNAETQTQITENLKDVGVQSKESIPVSIEINKENIEKTTTVETTSSSTTTTTVKSSACLKVFDEAPLERARKDRLSVLMGIKRKSSDMKMNQEEKPIMSILSSNINKHLRPPTPKHVTFNLESESSSESNQQQQQPVVEKTTNSTVDNNLSITQTTASITTPLISSVISETPKLPDKDVVQASNETKIIPKIASSLSQTTTTQSIPTFNFPATTIAENSTNSTKLINAVTSIVTATTSNMYENSNKMGNLPITTTITTTTSSTPPKIGGFKFDLNPKSTSSSKFTLVTSTTTTATESSQKPTFFFGGVTKTTPTTHTTLTTTTVAPKFNFTSSITTTTAAVTTTTTPATSFTQSGFGGFHFTPQTTQSFVNPVTTTTTVGLTTAFGNQPIKSNVFGTNPIVTTNTFGIQPTVSNIFGGITTQTTIAGTKSTFGAAQPTNIFGGIATTTTTPAVVAVTTVVTTTTSTFGIQPLQSTTFGSNPAPTFGSSSFNFGANNNSFTSTNSIDKPSFASLQTPQQNLFTATPTTTSSPVVTTTTTSIFNTNVFNSTNTTNNPPVFGLNNPPTTNIFGSNIPAVTTAPQNPPPPAFGFDVNKTTGFNTTSTTPAFGSTTFGTTTQNQPVFGSNLNSNNQPTQASSPPGGVFTFGANTVNKPTGVFSFGQSEPPKPTFNFTATPTNSTVGSGGGGVNSSFTNGNVSFGANPVTPQFNPPVGGAMFSIGSGGSSTPRARTQLKAKRRT